MIELYIETKIVNKRAGFAVLLKSGSHRWEKSMDCGEVAGNLAALHGVTYALASIKPHHRQAEIKLYTSNQYIHMMLEKDQNGYWEKVPKNYIEAVEEMRKRISGTPRITFALPSPGPDLARVKEMALTAAKEGRCIDNKN